MLLADHQITDRIHTGDLKISPFDPVRVQPASVDLLLDQFLRVPVDPGAEIDVARVWAGHTVLAEIDEDGWLMKPGDFLLASTVERVTLPPDLAARVEGKSSLGRLGLAVHVTAGFIDPGFSGQITLEIANLSPWPIRLRQQMPIAQLGLIPMAAVPQRPYGRAGNHYQGQYGPTESRYELR
ncbi:dCTP deaminase [Streptomyces sp. NBC_01242]|uniref:dCTP deaminase n=1 Tax=Streptomyces sp. NBC_01242 TaxID=2903795 RepID=UPI002253367E|nr:dCTP deaminase [Streptomyces sp. NBC_01242]MCX4799589.1 dCTP deaminase [Streptomyces sp. NBC_01242]